MANERETKGSADCGGGKRCWGRLTDWCRAGGNDIKPNQTKPKPEK